VDSFTLNKIDFDSVRQILGGFCRCSLGRALAHRISPSRSPEVIRHWLGQVTQMVQAIRDVSLPPFGGVTDITAALQRAQPGGGASGEDFSAIASTLEGAANVKAYLNGLNENLTDLHELAAGIADFTGEVHAIRSIVDPDGTVCDSASERLASVRREIAKTSQHIHDVIYGFLHQPDVAKLLSNVAVTLHGDRYVLPVKQENRGRLEGVVHRASNSGATVFVEPAACVELNNKLFDLYEDQRKEIQRLLGLLSLRVSAVAEPIHVALRALAQVDLLAAKAQYAYQFDMSCPEVAERSPLVFAQARHPLLIDQAARQEASGMAPERRHKVVPIDIRLGQDFEILVITGSNTGGKTVALKTVALLAVMAQSGMHIPVQRGAIMPVFRDVFIDVGDEQSLEQSLSTFGAHIKRIRYILRKADSACLVLLDELGSGTDPDEGGAIGQAVLDELREIGCLGMVTTHLSVLKAYAFSNERVDNASVAFDTATLSPTYHLLIGTPGESHAIAVASHLGMTRRIIGAAKQYLSSQGKQFRRAIQATSLVRQDAEEARAAAVEAQLAAQSQREVYEAKLADLHRLQEEFNTWLARLPELKSGDEVMVPSLQKSGHFVRLELHRQIALVDVENMQVEVPLKELMPDLGQEAVREQIANLRKQILDQAAAGEAAMAQARRVQEEYQHSLSQQKERARQFDTWLSMISRVKVGDEVAIAAKPGHGVLSSLDFTRLRAKVKVVRPQPRVFQAAVVQHQPAGGMGVPPMCSTGILPVPSSVSSSSVAAAASPSPSAAVSSSVPEQQQQENSQTQPGAAVPQQQQHDRAGTALENTGKMPVLHDDTVEIEISLQDLFPQTGPFAHLPPVSSHHEGAPPRRPEQRRREEPRRPQPQAARALPQAPRGLAYAQAHPDQRSQDQRSQDQRRQAAPPPKHDPRDDRPIERRSPDSKEAIANRDKLLATKPGDQVYVVPFHKRATLIRLNPDKDQAVVQSGIFEMEIPLADLEPVQAPEPAGAKALGPGANKPKQ
jgi:DNA mismatch repair protein MutS2